MKALIVVRSMREVVGSATALQGTRRGMFDPSR